MNPRFRDFEEKGLFNKVRVHVQKGDFQGVFDA